MWECGQEWLAGVVQEDMNRCSVVAWRQEFCAVLPFLNLSVQYPVVPVAHGSMEPSILTGSLPHPPWADGGFDGKWSHLGMWSLGWFGGWPRLSSGRLESEDLSYHGVY